MILFQNIVRVWREPAATPASQFSRVLQFRNSGRVGRTASTFITRGRTRPVWCSANCKKCLTATKSPVGRQNEIEGVSGRVGSILSQLSQAIVKIDAEYAVKQIEGTERVDKEIEGTERVDKEIDVLPLSPNDYRLRLALCRATYGLYRTEPLCVAGDQACSNHCEERPCNSPGCG